MQRLIIIAFTSLLTLLFVGCGTLTLAPDVSVTGDHPLSWSDVREIERLLPSIGIRQPIYSIYMEAPDRANVTCGRPGTGGGEPSGFTAIRRNGRWLPDKESISKGGRWITTA